MVSYEDSERTPAAQADKCVLTVDHAFNEGHSRAKLVANVSPVRAMVAGSEHEEPEN